MDSFSGTIVLFGAEQLEDNYVPLIQITQDGLVGFSNNMEGWQDLIFYAVLLPIFVVTFGTKILKFLFSIFK